MNGFEIKLNSQILTIGVNNGTTVINLHNDNGGLAISGIDDNTGEYLDWGRFPLNAGDVIYITACDIGNNTSPFQSTRMNREHLVTQYNNLKQQLKDLALI